MKRVSAGVAVSGSALLMAAGCLQPAAAQAAPAAAAAKAAVAASPAPVSSAGSLLAAAADARRQGSAVEVLPDRTDYSQTFANPDGTLTYDASLAPEWVQQGASWVRPDASLVQASDGSWSPAAAAAGLALSGGGGTTLATLTTGGKSLSVSWPTALPTPTVSGATATYAGVFPGVNLMVTATTDGGFDETLVIENQAAAADPQLSGLDLGVSVSGGLSQHASADGSVTMETAGGTPVFTSPPPLAWDSSSAGAGASGPGPLGGAQAATASYGTGSVRLGIPAALLSGPASSFPVYVDPTYSVSSTELTHDLLYSLYPSSSNWSTTEMGVGYTGTGIERSYFRMNVPSALYGATILSATFSDQLTNAEVAASTSHTVALHSTGAIGTSTTWASPPTWYTSPAPVSTTFTTTSTTPSATENWNVAPFVQAAATASAPNWTLVLSNSNETNSNYWVAFSAAPTISITYDFPPLTPSASSMLITPRTFATNGSQFTSSAKPTFSATAVSPVGANVSYQYEILSGSTVATSGTSASVTSGTPGPWTDTTALTDDSAYTFQVRAYDGTAYGPWSAAQSFTVETDTPGPVAVSCSGYPAKTWSAQQAGGSTCSWAAPLPYMDGYEWSLGGTWSWSASNSISINPGPGEYNLEVIAVSDAGQWGTPVHYDFAVGATGAMLSPVTGSQTSTSVVLWAGVPAGYTGAEYYYREGTTGTFQPVPQAQVTDLTCNCAVTWPAATTPDSDGVETDALSWPVTQTVIDDGPVQIEAEFTNSSGGTDWLAPVTVTLDRVGTGADYGTTTAGPVTVGLQSGNAALSATDVNIASYGADLTVSRTFNSVQPAAPSVFGPGWTTSLTGGVTTSWTQLSATGTYAALQSSDGTSDTFTVGSTSGSTVTWTPQGDAVTAGLTLTENTSNSTFTLTDSSGTVTVFGQENAHTATVYLPQTVTPTGTGTTGSTGIDYDGNSADASYGDPVLMVAPDAASSEPPTTACPNEPTESAFASTWTAGCRGLQFAYNGSGDVTQINFLYSDNSGQFHSVPVADYGYDASGRLTSEWDPRLSTPLVTGYTYDETTTDPEYGRITQVSPAQAAGSGALAPWTLTYDTTAGTPGYGNLASVSRTHSAAYGGATATTTIDYSVPLTTAADGPVNMDPATVGNWAQTDPPASAVAVFPPSHVPSSPPTASDWQYAQIDYYDANGKEVNTASYTGGAWAITTTQYDAYGNITWTLSAADQATALASSFPPGTATTLATVNVYQCDNFGAIDPSCDNNDQQYQVLTDTYGPAHSADVDGTDQTIRTHTAYAYDAGAPNSDVNAVGDPYMLQTSQTVSASVGDAIPATTTADARTTTYTYGTTTASWALGQPLTTVTDPSGLDIVDTSVYNMSSSLYGGASLQTDSYAPSDTSGGGAGDTQTVYYTAGPNPLVAACGNEPEWADLTCQTGPAAQPGTAGLPSLPVTTYTYDDYLNPVTKTETFGSTGTRTSTTGYDADERPVTQAIAVTGTGMGAAVPETQTVYSANSGLPTDTQTLNPSGTVTADINTTYDDFGQALTYTDASGNTTSYAYTIAGQVTSRADGKGTESFGYDTGGELTQITDSQAGVFTATYNADGSLLTETYPGGVTGTYAYDPTGTATYLYYNRPQGTAWSASLTDAIVPDAAGDWATQTVSDTAIPIVSQQTYAYDNADRLTAVLDTGDNQCRSYAYDTDSNRTSLTTATPGVDGLCGDATGAATANSSYDSADRDTSAGYAYDTQGDITTTPSADAGGNGNLTAAYSANDMLASQTQGSQSMTWTTDPTLGRYATYTQNGVTYTNHYSDTSSNPTWTSGSDGSWTRNITDFNGLLAAEVTTGGTVTLEFPDLHGNIMGTATTSTTATGPSATYVYTEFGIPEAGAAGTFGWLGGDQISSGALGGQLLMGARAYNANSGRFSQPDPIPGGSANAYDYTFQNPLTGYDLAGTWACQATRTTSSYRVCGQYISESAVKDIEAAITVGGGAAGLRAALLKSGVAMEIWLETAFIATVLLADVELCDNGHGEWFDVFEFRFIWQYPDWGWGGFYWAWGHSPWMPYWASLAG